MSHPVLFAIDDDPGVVRALRDDLGRRFGEDFRVIGTSSAAAGLAMLGELADEHVTVAVLIVGHRMREMPGAEFLARAHRMHPQAKRVLLVERDYSARSPVIPGFPHGISGHELTRRACEQAWIFGAHMVFSQPVLGLETAGDERIVRMADGHQITARTVIAAPGIAWRRLGVPRLEALVGSGVFYGAASSETQAMEARDVFVVGAGNSAGQTALHLAQRARQVTMLVRGDNLAHSMSEYLIREIEVTPNLTVRLNTEVTDGHGIEHLDTLTLHDVGQDRIEQVPATALFILIGGVPRTRWLPDTVQTDHGYILTGRDVVAGASWPPDRAPLPLETSLPGVFAAGDARYRSLKRVASAVGDGATAVRLVHEYLAAKTRAHAD